MSTAIFRKTLTLDITLLQNLTKAVSSDEATVFNDLIEPLLDVFDQIYEALELDQDPTPIIERERVLFHQSVIH